MMVVAAARGPARLRQSRPRRGSAVHDQDDGGEGAVAGRRREPDRQTAHRPAREAARVARVRRLPHQLHEAGRGDGASSTCATARHPTAVPDQWYQVRKKIGDIRGQLPQGAIGPFFNDDFGDVYGVVYALTTDGFTYRELRDQAEFIRAELLRVNNVGKVDLIGVQDEVIYHRLLAAPDGRPRYRPGSRGRDAREPERGDRLRHDRDAGRAHHGARQRRARLGGGNRERGDPCRRPAGADQGFRSRRARLQGSTRAAVPVQRRSRDRHRRLDGEGRQRARSRRRRSKGN